MGISKRFVAVLAFYAAVCMVSVPCWAIGVYNPAKGWRITGLSKTTLKPGDTVIIRGSFHLNGSDNIKKHDEFKPVIYWGTNTIANNYKTLELISTSDSEFKARVPYGVRPGNCKLMMLKFKYPQLMTNMKPVRVLPPDRPDICVGDVAVGFGSKKRWLKGEPRVTLQRAEYSRANDGKLVIDVYMKVKEQDYKSTGNFKGRVRWCNPKSYPHWHTCASYRKLNLAAGKERLVRSRVMVGYNHWKKEYANCVLLFQVNQDKKPKERTYRNNKREIMINFADFAACDLAILKLKNKTKKPRVGRPVSIELVIKNVGDKRSKRFEVHAFWGGSSKPELLRYPPLDPGNSYRSTLKHTFGRKGRYRLTCVVAPKNKLDEYRKDNNSKYVEFKVK